MRQNDVRDHHRSSAERHLGCARARQARPMSGGLGYAANRRFEGTLPPERDGPRHKSVGSFAVRNARRFQGDPELTDWLANLPSGRSRRTAVGVIDMGVTPATRFAFIGADKATRFEIGSITKCLTGMLLADAIQRGDLHWLPRSAR